MKFHVEESQAHLRDLRLIRRASSERSALDVWLTFIYFAVADFVSVVEGV